MSEEIKVNIGGKQVPLSLIRKPHNVVIGGRHKPVPDAAGFPDLEPQAKEQDQQKAFIDSRHKPVPDAETFPDLEPAAKEREAKLAEERAHK